MQEAFANTYNKQSLFLGLCHPSLLKTSWIVSGNPFWSAYSQARLNAKMTPPHFSTFHAFHNSYFETYSYSSKY